MVYLVQLWNDSDRNRIVGVFSEEIDAIVAGENVARVEGYRGFYVAAVELDRIYTEHHGNAGAWVFTHQASQ